MKLTELSFVILLSLFSLSSSFSQLADISDHYISGGIGFALIDAEILFDSYKESNNFEISNSGPFNIQYEGIFQDKIGFGIEVAYSKSSASWDTYNDDDDLFDNVNVSRTKLTGVARVNYHLALGETIDPYGSFGVGYKLNHWNVDTDSPYFVDEDFVTLGRYALLIRLGVRVMFIENFGAFIEAGGGHGLVIGGLAIKL